jgi:glycosyltransferase involved in cell wall biosynthesis
MMKIGIDARLPYYRRGGISQYTLFLLQALAELDHDNEYLVGQMGKDKADYAPPAPNFRRHDFYTPCHHRWERWALGAELRWARAGLDVWHSPDFIPPHGGAKRRLITVHDLNFLHFPQYLTADSLRYYRDQIGWAVQTADHIIADSEHTRQDLLNLLQVPAEKVTTVHLGVNPVYQQTYTPEQLQQTWQTYGLPQGFVLAVGTLEPRKNLPLLLRAYAEARAVAKLDVPLVLVGSVGWLEEDIWQTAADLGLRLGEEVRHLPGVSDEQVAHLYAGAGLLATPSFYEGFGLPALEAMTVGCPVLVSDGGSLPEIVGEAGLVLPVDEVGAWVAGITAVLTDSAQRETMVEAGRRRSQAFSWHNTATTTHQIYQALSC